MAKFNHKNPSDIAQLSKAVGYSYDTLKVFRDNRIGLMKEYVGAHYSESGSTDKVPINLLELAMNIYLQKLVAKNPAISITTDHKKLKEISNRFEIAGNHLIKEIRLGKTLETVVSAAMFSKGIVKIGLNISKVEVGGITHDSGQPFVDAISLDDWVEDMTASTNENGQYEGNYWYPTIDEAEELFPGETFTPVTEETNKHDKDHNISEGSTTQREEFRPTVKLLDLFLKKQNLILQCTTTDDDKDPIDKVLKAIKWKGPENGPYRKLGFAQLEGNTMPLAPAMHWLDMHELTNNLFRKLGRQATRQKTVTGVRPGGQQDGDRIINASDGDMIAMDDPRNVMDYNSGGIKQETLAFMMVVKDMFSYMAGNLDMLGGLGPQSETLGQDQLLSVSASMRVQKMQKEATEFTTDVLRDLMWYLWYDPNPKQKDVVRKLSGFESISITIPFNPDDREGDYLEYNLEMEPYSMQHQTPESKVQGLRTIFAEIIMPLIPMMEQQGITLDIESFFKKLAKLTSLNELNDIVRYSSPNIEHEPVGSSDQVGRPAATTRTNVRVNRPGATNSGKSQILQQALLGGKPQASEIASLTRPTG